MVPGSGADAISFFQKSLLMTLSCSRHEAALAHGVSWTASEEVMMQSVQMCAARNAFVVFRLAATLRCAGSDHKDDAGLQD